MLKLSSTRIDSRVDASGHGLPHTSKELGALAKGFTAIKNALMKGLFLFSRN
jgi:hypothetical protein